MRSSYLHSSLRCLIFRENEKFGLLNLDINSCKFLSYPLLKIPNSPPFDLCIPLKVNDLFSPDFFDLLPIFYATVLPTTEDQTSAPLHSALLVFIDLTFL